MVSAIGLPAQTVFPPVMVNWGKPPNALNCSKEKAALFALSLDTEITVVPTTRRCEAFPLPAVGCRPNAPEFTTMVVPAAKVRSTLPTQNICPFGPLITTLVKFDSDTFEDIVSVPLMVKTPDCPVIVVAFTLLPDAIV